MPKNTNKYLFFFLYSIIPLSLIIGNASININIILIDLLFIYECFKFKNFNFIREKIFLFLICIWIFLIINSIININETNESYDGLMRSLNLIRFIIFVYASDYFLKKFNSVRKKILISWTVILSIILFDIFFEKIIGHNIIGIVSPSAERISSFFGEELIVGAFILGFGFIISTFLLKNSEKLTYIKKIFSNLFLILVPFAIFVTGERSNYIKSLIIFTLLLFFINKRFLLLKKKIILISSVILIFISIILSKNIFNRQIAIFEQLNVNDKIGIVQKIKNIQYGEHYLLAWSIFLENKWLGIGTKNFRYVCNNQKYTNEYPRGCTTHPHQLYFELLCEQGIIGFIIFLSFFIFVLVKNCKIYINNKNLYHLTPFLFYIAFLIPLLPSGSFFSTFNASLFWLNFSLMNHYSKKI